MQSILLFYIYFVYIRLVLSLVFLAIQIPVSSSLCLPTPLSAYLFLYQKIWLSACFCQSVFPYVSIPSEIRIFLNLCNYLSISLQLFFFYLWHRYAIVWDLNASPSTFVVMTHIIQLSIYIHLK